MSEERSGLTPEDQEPAQEPTTDALVNNGDDGADNAEDIMAQAMAQAARSNAGGEDFDTLSEDDARLIELVGFLVQGIVEHPEEVEVEEFFDDVGSIYGVRVHPDDVGRVIGKEGRIANALRHLVKAAATKTGARVSVEIITEDMQLDVVEGNQ